MESLKQEIKNTYYRIELSPLSKDANNRGQELCRQTREVLNLVIEDAVCRDVYSIFVSITLEQVQDFCKRICNPILQTVQIDRCTLAATDWLISIAYLPGVTDNVAHSSRDAMSDVIGRNLGENEAIYTSWEYWIQALMLDREAVTTIANELLSNPHIHKVHILSRQTLEKTGIPINRASYRTHLIQDRVDRISLDIDDSALIALSTCRHLALNLKEMQAIQTYFQQNGKQRKRRELGLDEKATDTELEVLAQTWSEHCKHKIFNATIDYYDEDGGYEQIESCYTTFIQKSTQELSQKLDWLVSVFKDNAGVISFNSEYNLVYKVETHNSPAAIDPYGGAMTGIIGVNRDPLGTGLGAELLINVWGYCLASPLMDKNLVPKELLHPRRIRDGVHQGVIDGGNQSGIPYGYGWEYFDDCFMGKPLVFCGTVGLLPKRILGQPAHEKQILPGDLIVMAGGRIGKDGLHGATFSSEVLHQESPSHAVQIGDPITQKKLSDFLIEARNHGLYRFITDNGAGGLSGSVGEMAIHCNGCRLDVSKAPLKYQGLQPWEILLSEAQERMTLAVPPEKIDRLETLASARDVEVTVLGTFNDSGYFHVCYDEETIAYIDLEFMHNGCPRMQLKARWTTVEHRELEASVWKTDNLSTLILHMLSRLNHCSNEENARQYDHEVKGLSVIKPFVGCDNNVPSDASVFMLEPMAKEGIVLGYGVNPRYSLIDTYHMTASVIDMAVRRCIAAGANPDHIAGLDNFCWPDSLESEHTPDGQYKLAQLVRANKALYDLTTAFKVPCISGKDSMKNDSTRGGKKLSIYPTLLFSTIAKLDDISKAVSMDPKCSGDLVYILGDTKKELGGSEFYAMYDCIGNRVPTVDVKHARQLYQVLNQAIQEELCHSIHSPTLGGLGIGFAKMTIAGGLGMDIDLDAIPCSEAMDIAECLFSESNSRFIVTISTDCRRRFEALLKHLVWARVGVISGSNTPPYLCLYKNDTLLSKIDRADLSRYYSNTLN